MPTVAVLIVVVHVPIMPLEDVNGNAGATEFDTGPIAANVGVIWWLY
jgi:hypothetical protein